MAETVPMQSNIIPPKKDYRNISTNANSKAHLSPWIIWGLGAAFFFVEYYARVSPSVMAADLMGAFQVNAFALGSLSAMFYYAYISMQLPVGMLMDHYGPHRLLTTTALICAIGSFIFAFAPNIFVANLGRLLMGFGAAFAFVGSLKLASIWFPASRFGLMAGMTQAIGMLGAATGEGPMAVLVSHIGWQNTMILIGIVFIVLAMAIALVVRDAPAHHSSKQSGMRIKVGLLTSLKRVLMNPQSWVNASYAGLVYAPSAAFAELWGVSFLERAYAVDTKQAAAAIGMIFIGWGIGGPVAGWLSDKIGRRKPLMYVSAFADLILLSFILYVHMPIFMVYSLLFLYGFFNAGVAISYALASEINPRPISGTSMAFANMASVLIGAAFQPIIGYLLVKHWSGKMLNGIPLYTINDYKMALIVLPICLILGFIITIFIRESYCRSTN